MRSILILLSVLGVTGGASAQWPLAELPIPTGIAVDARGFIIVNHDGVEVFNRSARSWLLPGGQVAGRVHLPGGRVAGARMATIPGQPYVYEVLDNGDFGLVNPDNGTLQVVLNLRLIPHDISRIYDISTGVFGNMAGVVQPWIAHYGDLAVLSRGQQLDVFVAGLSVATPFVVRMRWEAGLFQGSRVIVSSSASDPSNFNRPRGIAVRQDGTVVTGLPLFNRGGIINAVFDSLATFQADFDTTGAGLPQFFLGPTPVYSNGMTADRFDNVYVATASIGTLATSDSIVTLPPALDAVTQVTASGSLQNTADLAVNQDATWLYATHANLRELNRFSGVTAFQIADALAPTLVGPVTRIGTPTPEGTPVSLEAAVSDSRGVVEVIMEITSPGGGITRRPCQLQSGHSVSGTWGCAYTAPRNASGAPQTYSVKALAKDSYGNEARTPAAAFIIPPEPATVPLQDFTISIADSILTLSWRGGKPPYTVQVSADLQTWLDVSANLTATTHRYSLEGLTAPHLFFRIKEAQ